MEPRPNPHANHPGYIALHNQQVQQGAQVLALNREIEKLKTIRENVLAQHQKVHRERMAITEQLRPLQQQEMLLGQHEEGYNQHIVKYDAQIRTKQAELNSIRQNIATLNTQMQTFSPPSQQGLFAGPRSPWDQATELVHHNIVQPLHTTWDAHFVRPLNQVVQGPNWWTTLTTARASQHS
jgi:hypothetical protein